MRVRIKRWGELLCGRSLTSWGTKHGGAAEGASLAFPQNGLPECRVLTADEKLAGAQVRPR